MDVGLWSWPAGAAEYKSATLIRLGFRFGCKPKFFRGHPGDPVRSTHVRSDSRPGAFLSESIPNTLYSRCPTHSSTGKVVPLGRSPEDGHEQRVQDVDVVAPWHQVLLQARCRGATSPRSLVTATSGPPWPRPLSIGLQGVDAVALGLQVLLHQARCRGELAPVLSRSSRDSNCQRRHGRPPPDARAEEEALGLGIFLPVKPGHYLLGSFAFFGGKIGSPNVLL
jgi:hypothetical protein